jgi:ribonuclease P/MRP protein subunit POP8
MSIDSSLDALQVRAYCTSALRQFLGDTGAAISVDILAVRNDDIWVRVPRADLAGFSAALTAYGGMARGRGVTTVLRLRACGDWLGSLLGRAEQQELWAS